jgi:NTE family protein
MREMRAVSFVTELIDAGKINGGALDRMPIHGIAADAEFAKPRAASKLNADRRFLGRLREAGRRHADDWLATNFDLLGAKSTVDLKEFSLGRIAVKLFLSFARSTNGHHALAAGKTS